MSCWNCEDEMFDIMKKNYIHQLLEIFWIKWGTHTSFYLHI